MLWIWLGLAVVLLLIELATVQLVCIWLCVGALVSALFVALFPYSPVLLQILIFIIVSAALLLSTRKIAMRMVKDRRVDQSTNVDINIGKEAVVTETINNLAETGAIKLGGMTWTARADGGDTIEKGEIVIFKSVVGNKAIVARRQTEKDADEGSAK